MHLVQLALIEGFGDLALKDGVMRMFSNRMRLLLAGWL